MLLNHIAKECFFELYCPSRSSNNSVFFYTQTSFFVVFTHSNLDTKAFLRELGESNYTKSSREFLFLYTQNSTLLRNYDAFNGIIMQFDFDEGFFSHVNFNFPPISFRTTKGKLVELKVRGAATPYLDVQKSDVQSFDLSEISVLCAATTNLGSLIFKKIYAEIFSKKDILNYVRELGESLLHREELFSFFIINCDINRHIEYSRTYKIAPELSSARMIEEELERLMEEYFRDQNISAKASLVINELLLNAYEHGILGISSEEKHKMMEQGCYDEFLTERERGVDGLIELEATFYAKGLLKIRIKDSGCGFDFDNYLKDEKTQSEYSGRGIQMSKNIANAIFFQDKGRDVTFFIKYDGKSILKDTQELTESEVLSVCSALYVEDEPVIRSLFEGYLKKRLKIVYVANDGLDGLEQFKKYKPDIVISDVSMPNLNGLEMVRAIKDIAPDTLVMLTTAHDYEANIYEAIQIGVDKFLSKPIELDIIRSALFAISKKLAAKRQESDKERELSLADLRAANKYQLSQHEMAGEKQKLLIHNDANFIDGLKIEVVYKPLEYLSGDMYGVFRLSEGVSLFYIVDCMDKGLVASVTSVLSSAFLVENIKQAILCGTLSVLELANEYEAYIERYLLEDECISYCFLMIDQTCKSIQYTASGMYPLLIRDKTDGVLKQIRSQNPPFMKGDRTKEIIKSPLPKSCTIILYSDGACEFEEFSFKQFLDFAEKNIDFVSYKEKLTELLSQNKDGLKDDVSFIFVESKGGD